jgi:RNA polymerase sigma-70 factor (ECF subfamily)
MSADDSFQALLRRVRAGNEDAAAEVVRKYEPAIRRMVRMRLTDPRLTRLLDSVDVCQSVLANFFVRMAAGQFDLDTPEQLMKLLSVMARNRLLDHVAKQTAGRRDQRRMEAEGQAALEAQAATEPSPSRVIAARDLLERMRAMLSDEERFLADQRALGRDWADIAHEVGGSAEALRKRLARAVDRAARGLGLDEVTDA